MRVTVDALRLPINNAALNAAFRDECLRAGKPIFDDKQNVVGVDLPRPKLHQLSHKHMMRHMGYTDKNMPPMFLDVPAPNPTDMPVEPPHMRTARNQEGVGTELKKVLNQYNISFSPVYDAFMYKLNEKTIQDCSEHVEEILDVLEDEAYRNRIEFDRDRTEIMVRFAIRQAKKKSVQNG